MNAREPEPLVGIPPCPKWLDKEAKAEWKRVTAELAAIGMLCIVDRATLATYCQAWAEFHDATVTLQTEGREITAGENGYRMPHPAISRQRSAWKAIKDFAACYGLDPASRSRLRVQPAKKQEDQNKARTFKIRA